MHSCAVESSAASARLQETHGHKGTDTTNHSEEEEDISDAAYARRHTPLEEAERKLLGLPIGELRVQARQKRLEKEQKLLRKRALSGVPGPRSSTPLGVRVHTIPYPRPELVEENEAFFAQQRLEQQLLLEHQQRQQQLLLREQQQQQQQQSADGATASSAPLPVLDPKKEQAQELKTEQTPVLDPQQATVKEEQTSNPAQMRPDTQHSQSESVYPTLLQTELAGGVAEQADTHTQSTDKKPSALTVQSNAELPSVAAVETPSAQVTPSNSAPSAPFATPTRASSSSTSSRATQGAASPATTPSTPLQDAWHQQRCDLKARFSAASTAAEQPMMSTPLTHAKLARKRSRRHRWAGPMIYDLTRYEWEVSPIARPYTPAGAPGRTLNIVNLRVTSVKPPPSPTSDQYALEEDEYF